MGHWSSLRGSTGTFPTVVSTCANQLSPVLQWIASLPVIIPRTFSSLYYTFLTLKSGQLTLGRRVLDSQHENNSDIKISESIQAANVLELLLIRIVQTEKLPVNTSTAENLAYCSTAYNSHLRSTIWIQSAIYQFILKGKADVIPIFDVLSSPTDAGSSTKTSPQSTPLKRKASSALIGKEVLGKSRARKPSNNKRGDEDDHPNPRDPNHPEELNDHAVAEPEKYFACHFFKLNPREYHRCGSKQLRTLDNLKQHLKRAHYTASLHCRCCWTEFGDHDESHQALRDHARGECVQRQGPDTLYDEDLRLLRTDRGSSPKEKWYQIWRQICEGHEEPDSPYIELNGIDEFGGLISRELRSRFNVGMHGLRNELEGSPELSIFDVLERVGTVSHSVFSNPTLFEARYRRIFRPINVPPTGTNQAPEDHEAHSDDGSHDAPLETTEPRTLYQPDDEGHQQAEGPRSPSDVLPNGNGAEESNLAPHAPQSYVDLLQVDPALFDDSWVDYEE